MAFLAEASARTKPLRTEGASALEAQNKGHPPALAALESSLAAVPKPSGCLFPTSSSFPPQPHLLEHIFGDLASCFNIAIIKEQSLRKSKHIKSKCMWDVAH